jgi:hypothetical protein
MIKKINWAWAIGIIYSVFVIILIGLIIFSFNNRIDLVSNDYYAQELKYQQQIDRINRSRTLPKPIKCDYNKTENEVSLEYPKAVDHRKITGEIIFFRPSDARQDKLVRLQLDNNSKQKIDVQSLSSGFWRVKIFWKLDALEYYNEVVVVIE